MGMPNSPGVKLWHVAGSWNRVLLMMLCEFRFLTHCFCKEFFSECPSGGYFEFANAFKICFHLPPDNTSTNEPSILRFVSCWGFCRRWKTGLTRRNSLCAQQNISGIMLHSWVLAQKLTLLGTNACVVALTLGSSMFCHAEGKSDRFIYCMNSTHESDKK